MPQNDTPSGDTSRHPTAESGPRHSWDPGFEHAHLLHRTFSPRVLRSGSVEGLFQLDFANRLFSRNYQDPILVARLSRIGDRPIAERSRADRHAGSDLVAGGVNEVVSCGAEPLFFLASLALADSTDTPLTRDLMSGISDGCLEADCALLETREESLAKAPAAERPRYDLAGFCVGVVERDHLIDGQQIHPGDAVLGLAAGGLQASDQRLLARLLQRQGKSTLGPSEAVFREALEHPVAIYARGMRRVLNYYKVKSVVHGIAHVHSKGLKPSLEQILPAGMNAEWDTDAWPIPDYGTHLQQLEDRTTEQMLQDFSMGIGYAMVVSAYYADRIARLLKDSGYRCWKIGQIGPA